MRDSLTIAIRKQEDFEQFLVVHGFDVDDLGDGNYRVQRQDELPVFVNITSGVIRFQADVCPVSAIDSKEQLFRFLDLNTDIIPVSFGIDNTNAAEPRLVLVESRNTHDISDSELLGVFDAMELALDRAEAELSSTL